MKQKKEESKKRKLIKQILFSVLAIILIIILILLFKNVYNKLKSKKYFENDITSFSEKNKDTIFSINKIMFFSSCDSKNKTTSQTNFTIENLYAYTDIAIFIDNNTLENKNEQINSESNSIENNETNMEEQKETLTAENTLKNVKITNIKFTKKPEIGNGNIYYKNVNNFAKSEINEKNKIENELQFETTSENKTNLDKPILYNNCANPITYNGKLLKRCGVSVKAINTSISFDIEIENNKNQRFRTTIYFDIPYESEEKSINDGSIIVEKKTNFNFYRYE